jgi:hypothetical protein
MREGKLTARQTYKHIDEAIAQALCLLKTNIKMHMGMHWGV